MAKSSASASVTASPESVDKLHGRLSGLGLFSNHIDSFSLCDINSSSSRSTATTAADDDSVEACAFAAGPSFSCPLIDHSDYGHYEDCDETVAVGLPGPVLAVPAPLTPVKGSALPSNKRPAAVLCALEHRKAPIACRSFGQFSVCLSLGGFRLVHEGHWEVSEYKVLLTVDGVQKVAWKRFAEFATLGEACAGCAHMNATSTAWAQVLRHRPWWTKPSTHVDYLQAESRLLAVFLKHLLFEVPCIAILQELVRS